LQLKRRTLDGRKEEVTMLRGFSNKHGTGPSPMAHPFLLVAIPPAAPLAILLLLSPAPADAQLADTNMFTVSKLGKHDKPPTPLYRPSITCQAFSRYVGVQYPAGECTTEYAIHLNDNSRIPLSEIRQARFKARKVPAQDAKLLHCKGKVEVIEVNIIRLNGDSLSGLMWMAPSCRLAYYYGYSLTDFPMNGERLKLALHNLLLERSVPP
jgi:hypothetical protein